MMDTSRPSLARIKIKFPDQIWISEIFKNYPDIKMEISHFLPYDLEKSIGNSLVEILHYDIDSIIEEIRTHPSVFELSVLEKEENKIKFTRTPHFIIAYNKNGSFVFTLNLTRVSSFSRTLISSTDLWCVISSSIKSIL